MSIETLGHAVEEGRHALRLKRLAIKAGGATFDSYRKEKLLCADAAEDYFQNLDRHCECLFEEFPESERTRLTYLYVTLLVELRALDVYGHYQKSMSDHQLPFPLHGLLKEEEGHLHSVESELRDKDPLFLPRLSEIRRFEEKLYRDFVRSLEDHLFSTEAISHAQP